MCNFMDGREFPEFSKYKVRNMQKCAILFISKNPFENNQNMRKTLAKLSGSVFSMGQFQQFQNEQCAEFINIPLFEKYISKMSKI